MIFRFRSKYSHVFPAPSLVFFPRPKWLLPAAIRSYASSPSASNALEPSRTRNIGIIAHIDAGKTTTTERMLFYSGYIRRIGDVDDGSTVTDFLPAERARGITIQSAAITFEWPPKRQEPESADLSRRVDEGIVPRSSLSHSINLIDTPGHADFTFEVRRAIRVLDGAVCILDGVAGVEAQTEQVWKQAGEWDVPRIVYVNKLDRDGAAFGRTVKEVASRLGGWPAVCQIPWWEGGKGRFTGVADVINLRGLYYPEGGDGKVIKMLNFEELKVANPHLAKELARARVALVELLAEHDDAIIDQFLESCEDHLAVPAASILSSLRKCLLGADCRIIPLFAGASFRNIGVQPLLDAVVNLLPEPRERPDSEISVGAVKGKLQDLLDGKLIPSELHRPNQKGQKASSITSTPSPADALQGCALAFKVVDDPQKGVLVYIRVYSGSIQRGATLYNSNLNVSEKATRLLRMYASDSVSVQSIEAGQIGVIVGLKHARTGDTLIGCTGSKAAPPEPLNLLQLRPIQVPPPVFIASIEPDSLREEKDLRQKLGVLLREDPSLQVTQDEDTGQTLLSGMGELHLEIAQDRLVKDLKAKATMGQIEIGYRETVLHSSQKVTKLFTKESAGRASKAGCTAFVEPYDSAAAAAAVTSLPSSSSSAPSEAEEAWSQELDGNRVTILTPQTDGIDLDSLPEDTLLSPTLSVRDVRTAYLNGALAALSRGPRRSYQVRNVHVTLAVDPAEHLFTGSIASTISSLSIAARQGTTTALQEAASNGKSALMEPVMDVTISVDEASLGSVMQDISSNRGGHVMSLVDDDDDEGRHNDNDIKPINLAKVYAPPDPFGQPEPNYANTTTTTTDIHIQPHNKDNNNANPNEPTTQPTHSPHQQQQQEPPPRTVKAKVPLKEMIGYLKHLRSITGGRGTFVMKVDRFERMSKIREKKVVGAAGF